MLATALPAVQSACCAGECTTSATANWLFFEDYVDAAPGSRSGLVEVAAPRHLDCKLDLSAFDPALVRAVDPARVGRGLVGPSCPADPARSTGRAAPTAPPGRG